MIELLVAIVIAVILILASALMVSSSLQIANGTNNTLGALSAANAAMDLIAADLSNLDIIKQPLATVQTSSSVVSPGYVEYLQALPEGSSSTYISPLSLLNGLTPVRVMLLCSSPQDSYTTSSTVGPDAALPRYVCYRILYQDPLNPSNTTAGSQIFGLYRQVASSASTAANMISSMTGTGSTLLTYWKNTGGAPTTSNFLIGNVVDFEFVAYANTISNGQLVQPPIPIYNSSLDTSPGDGTVAYVSSTTPGSKFQVSSSNPFGNVYSYGSVGPIQYVEVSMVVLEDRGAKLWGSGTGTGATSPAILKQKYGHTLTRKIILRSY